VLVLSSIRKPKRITIRGDDEKEYMFLVKGGEDLRLDQRIEQVNHIRVLVCGCRVLLASRISTCYIIGMVVS